MPAVRSSTMLTLRVAEERQVNSDMTPEDFKVIGVGCDVSSELSVQRAFEQVMDTFGRLDSVVASAGKFLHSCGRNMK